MHYFIIFKMTDKIRKNVAHFANLNDVALPVYISHDAFNTGVYSNIIRLNTGFCRFNYVQMRLF